MNKMWLVVSISPSTGRQLGCPGLAIEFGNPCLFKTKEEADYIVDKFFPDLMIPYPVSVGKVDKKTIKEFYNTNKPRRRHAAPANNPSHVS